MIYKFDLWGVRDRDIFFLYLKDYSLCCDCIFFCFFWEEEILYDKREGKSVQENDENTRIHKESC